MKIEIEKFDGKGLTRRITEGDIGESDVAADVVCQTHQYPAQKPMSPTAPISPDTLLYSHLLCVDRTATSKQNHSFTNDPSQLEVYMCDSKAANTRRCLNAGLMLGQRRRRWANISLTSSQRVVFAGKTAIQKQ